MTPVPHAATDLVVQAPAPNPAAVGAVAARLGRGPDHAGPCDARWRGAVADPEIPALADAFGADAAFVPHDRRLADFRLVAMDMDSTLITIECIDEIADRIGAKPRVAAITEAAMRGELDFPGALRARVALLAGLPESELQHVYDERLRLSPGAETMLAGMRAAGLRTLLVSGGFTFFTERLRARLGLDHALANTLESADGRLTGRVLGEIVDAERKAAELRRVCAGLGCDPARAIAIGDGANDLRMMAAAGVGVAYHAKPVVRAQATYALGHCGLDGVLRLFA
jgi:phosphoserine phosphatase